MARFVGTPLRGVEFVNPGDEALSLRVVNDPHARLRIDAGGRLTWSSGAATGDVNLYRDGNNALITDDTFEAVSGIITLVTAGAPSAALPDGALAVDTTNDRFYFRSDSTWRVVQGGATVSANAPDSPIEGALWFDTDDGKLYVRQGNAWVLAGGGGSSVTVSDNEPASPTVGNLWYESDTGKMFIYYDSFWVEVSGDTGPQGPAGPAGPAMNTQDIRIAVAGAGEIDTSTGNLTLDSAGGTVTVDDNLTVTGNLTVSGTTTSVNTETVTIDDNIIVLNNNATGAPSENAGIEVERGSSVNVALRWNESTDKWQFTNDGTTYSDLGAGGSTISVSPNPPASPTEGNLWFDSDTAQTFIYYDSQWLEIGAGIGGGGSSSISVSPNPPASPSEGNLWFDSDTAQTFIYYDSQWVEVGGSTGGAVMQVSSSAPASPLEGRMWFDSDTAQTFVYYDSQWVEIGASAMAATVSANAPVSPISGQIWLDSDTGGVYVYYSNVWIEVGAVPQLTSAAITTALGYTPANSSTAATTGKAIAMSIVFGG